MKCICNMGSRLVLQTQWDVESKNGSGSAHNECDDACLEFTNLVLTTSEHQYC